MKKLFVAFVLIVAVESSFLSYAGSKITRYQNRVKKACGAESISPLLLKKSLIELVKGVECSDAKFTKIVVNKCQAIDCGKINEIFREIEQTRSGSVVGDE